MAHPNTGVGFFYRHMTGRTQPQTTPQGAKQRVAYTEVQREVQKARRAQIKDTHRGKITKKISTIRKNEDAGHLVACPFCVPYRGKKQSKQPAKWAIYLIIGLIKR